MERLRETDRETMKAESTIRKHIRKLRSEAENSSDKQRRQEAWVALHTLIWILEDVRWTPDSLLQTATKARDN